VERDKETSATRVLNFDVEGVRVLQEETDFGLGELWFSGTLGGGL
jgi:hypothetical protein